MKETRPEMKDEGWGMGEMRDERDEGWDERERERERNVIIND